MTSYIERAKPFSKCSIERLWITWHCCKEADARGIEGDFVECGVWRGGNVMVARWASPSRRCWLFDTFNGMTEPGQHDTDKKGQRLGDHKIGKLTVSRDEVTKNLRSVGVYDLNHLVFVGGDVRKTLLDTYNWPDQIAVLRLDTDWYESTKIELEILYPRLASGGYLIIDDYGYWLGARKAVDEYFGKDISLLQSIDSTGVWMKKP